MTEISDEELERRLRANGWADKITPALPADDRMMAEKLFGKSEAERYARSRGKGFRFRAPIVTAEYFVAPDAIYGRQAWTISVFVNGARWRSKDGMTREECLAIIRRLEKRGVTVRMFVTEAMRKEQEAAQQRAAAPRQPQCQKGSDRYRRRFGGLV